MSLRSLVSKGLRASSASTPSRRAALFSSQFTRTMASSHSIPSTMKGVIIEKTGGSEVLQHKTDLPVPQAKEGQILVKNDFLGINYIDTYFRSGLYPAPHFPYILGREASGTVVGVGSSNTLDFKTGDRVVWMDVHAYAEYTAVPAGKAIKIPQDLDGKIAAAALLQGLTALTLVREAHPVKKGDWVLVHAAAGGTGLWLVQLLKSIGANTIATASTPEKLETAKKAGATHLVNSSSEDIVARVKELTNGKGVIAAFDGVGKATFDISLDSLARLGSLISFGNASGAVDPVTISRLSAKNNRLMRPTLFNFLVEREELETYTKELFQFVQRDGLDVKVHEVYPLSEVKRAHDDLEGRKTSGKLLLDPSK